jgi:hypothetical protein
MVWDILATISDDKRVVRHSRIRFATFGFVFSRLVYTATYLIIDINIL